MIESGLLHFGDFFIGVEFALLTIFVLVAAAYDIKERRIPNLSIVAGLFTSLIYHAASGYGYGFKFWIIGLSVGFFIFLPFYIFRAMGAGDVKLMALVGSFLGIEATLLTIVLILASGGILAFLVMGINKSWKIVLKNLRFIMTNIAIATITKQIPIIERPTQSAGDLPYAVAIATGTLVYICFFRP